MDFIRVYLPEVIRHGYAVWRRFEVAGGQLQKLWNILLGLLPTIGVVVAINWASAGYSKPDWGPAIALGTACWFVLCFGILGPYRAYQAQRKRAEDAEAQLVSGLRVGEPIVHTAREGQGGPLRMYVQLPVSAAAKKTIRRCQGRLTHVLRFESGAWKEIFVNTCSCIWSYAGNTIDIAPDAPQRLDIVSARDSSHVPSLRPEVNPAPVILTEMLQISAPYRFRIVVEGGDTSPIVCVVEVDATQGKASDIKVRLV